MPLQLRFFAIALQSKVHNAVQYFFMGPHFVPKRDINMAAEPLLLALFALAVLPFAASLLTPIAIVSSAERGFSLKSSFVDSVRPRPPVSSPPAPAHDDVL